MTTKACRAGLWFAVLVAGASLTGCRKSSVPANPVAPTTQDTSRRVVFKSVGQEALGVVTLPDKIRLGDKMVMRSELLPAGLAQVEGQLNAWRQGASTQPAMSRPEGPMPWHLPTKAARNEKSICRQIRITHRTEEGASQPPERTLFERHDFLEMQQLTAPVAISSEDWQSQLPAWTPHEPFVPGSVRIYIDYFVRADDRLRELDTLSFMTASEIEPK